MGYVHDESVAYVLPVGTFQFVTGTWADAVDSHVWTKNKVAGDEVGNVRIPVIVPSNGDTYKGFLLSSVEIHFEVETAALDAMSAAVYKASMPEDGSAIVPASVSFTYDAGHDADAERIDVDHHQMVLTITTPFWIDADEMVWVELSVDAAATSVYKQGDAIAKGTLRI